MASKQMGHLFGAKVLDTSLLSEFSSSGLSLFDGDTYSSSSIFHRIINQ
jgi:hypothetical protein